MRVHRPQVGIRGSLDSIDEETVGSKESYVCTQTTGGHRMYEACTVHMRAVFEIMKDVFNFYLRITEAIS